MTTLIIGEKSVKNYIDSLPPAERLAAMGDLDQIAFDGLIPVVLPSGEITGVDYVDGGDLDQ